MHRIPAEFVGVPPQTLQTWLTQLQQALQDLSTGAKVEVAAYAQADGQKSITYTRATMPALRARIQELSQVLYGRAYRRRPMRPLYL